MRLWFEGVRNRFDQDSPERSGAFKKYAENVSISHVTTTSLTKEKKMCGWVFGISSAKKTRKKCENLDEGIKKESKKSAEVRKTAGAAFKSFSVSFIFGFYFNIHLTIARCKISPAMRYVSLSVPLSVGRFGRRSVNSECRQCHSSSFSIPSSSSLPCFECKLKKTWQNPPLRHLPSHCRCILIASTVILIAIAQSWVSCRSFDVNCNRAFWMFVFLVSLEPHSKEERLNYS